jgi:hypothetical protein
MTSEDKQVTLEAYSELLSSLKVKAFTLPRDEQYRANRISISQKMDHIIRLKHAIEKEINQPAAIS